MKTKVKAKINGEGIFLACFMILVALSFCVFAIWECEAHDRVYTFLAAIAIFCLGYFLLWLSYLFPLSLVRKLKPHLASLQNKEPQEFIEYLLRMPEKDRNMLISHLDRQDTKQLYKIMAQNVVGWTRTNTWEPIPCLSNTFWGLTILPGQEKVFAQTIITLYINTVEWEGIYC